MTKLKKQPVCGLADPAAPDPLGLAAENLALREALRQMIRDLDDLMASSRGVDGLHFNGEVAEWGDLLRGGEYSSWLESIDSAAAALASPSPAVEAVREVLRTGALVRDARRDQVAAFNIPGGAQSRADMRVHYVMGLHEHAVDHLRTHFPALAAGLKEEP